jgi:hypothetical protein
MERRLQVVVNVWLLMPHLVGTALKVKALLAPTPWLGRRRSPDGTRPPRLAPPLYQPGDLLALKDVDFAAAEQTLANVGAGRSEG